MSLINDALKKAQRQRTDEPADATAPAAAGGGARIARRGPARSANTMVLFGAGAVVLVVLSVVITVFLVNRPAKPAAPAPGVAAPVSTAPGENTPAPSIVPPTISLPPATAPAPKPSAPPSDPAPVASTPLSPPAAPPPASVAAPAEPQIDERVAAFVDAIRVTGIRSFGAESRVLMNERVYRVNDVVDRTLGVRLTVVTADSLTFTDAKGKTYVKIF